MCYHKSARFFLEACPHYSTIIFARVSKNFYGGNGICAIDTVQSFAVGPPTLTDVEGLTVPDLPGDQSTIPRLRSTMKRSSSVTHATFNRVVSRGPLGIAPSALQKAAPTSRMGFEEPEVQTFPLASSMSDTQFRHVPLGDLIVWSTNHAPERRTTATRCRLRPSVAQATVSAGPLFEICCWTFVNVVQVEPLKTACQIRASVVTAHTCSSVGCATGVKPASAPAHEISANGPTRPAPGILTTSH